MPYSGALSDSVSFLVTITKYKTPTDEITQVTQSIPRNAMYKMHRVTKSQNVNTMYHTTCPINRNKVA